MGRAVVSRWLAVPLALLASCRATGPAVPPSMSPGGESPSETTSSSGAPASSGSLRGQQAAGELEPPPELAADPNAGERLLREGIERAAQGDKPAAQKLFDRARYVLERRASEKAVPEVQGGLWNVSSMAWSADGSSLAIAEGRRIHVVRIEDRREHFRFEVDGARVMDVAISPDSRTLAASTAAGKIALWDLASGAPSGTLECDRPGLQSLAFSPDGQLLAARNWESASVEVWTQATRAHLRLEASFGGRLPGLRVGTGDVGERPQMIAFSPDGKDLLGVDGGALALWSLSADKAGISRVLKPRPSAGDGDELASVAYGPDGRTAASGTESGRIHLWNLTTGRVVASRKAHDGPAQLSFTRDGRTLVSVASDGRIRTFDAKSLALRATLDSKMSSASATTLGPGARAAAIAGEGAVVVRDVASGQLSRIVAPGPSLSAVAVSGDPRRLAIGTTNGAVMVLSGADGSIVRLSGHAGSITSLAFSKDGTALASTSTDKTARIWQLGTRTTTRLLEHPQAVNAITFRADGRTVATACDDALVRVWDVATKEEPAVLTGSRCAVLAVAYSADGALLLGNSADHGLLRWDARTLAPLEKVDRGYNCTGELAASPNTLGVASTAGLVASAPSGNAVELWSEKTGQSLGSLSAAHGAHVRSLAASPRDPIVVAGGASQVDAWQVAERKALASLPAPGGADALAFSPDGLLLVGASHQGALSIWAMPSGRLALTVKVLDDSSAVAMAPSGLVEPLGSTKPDVACRIGQRLYPAELCLHTVSGLLRAVMDGKGTEALEELREP